MRNLKHYLKTMVGPLLGVALILAALGVLPLVAGAEGEPNAGTTQSIQTVTLYSPGAITTTGTRNSTGQRLQFYNAADVFVNLDMTAALAAIVTVTVQGSPDGTNYADLDYEYVQRVTTATTVIATQTYRRVMSAGGTEVIRIPMTGEYLRVSLVSTGTFTPVVKATLRNN